MGLWTTRVRCSLDDQEFIQRVKEKIERLTGREIDLEIDRDHQDRLTLELDSMMPRVVIGSNVLEHAGFGRLAIEYAVASIRRGAQVSQLEFQALLSRN